MPLQGAVNNEGETFHEGNERYVFNERWDDPVGIANPIHTIIVARLMTIPSTITLAGCWPEAPAESQLWRMDEPRLGSFWQW
jgi:hypothetical protein